MNAAPTILLLAAWLVVPACLAAADKPLTKDEATAVTASLWEARMEALAAERRDELEKGAVTLEGRTLRFVAKSYGKAPAGGASLWISMHGGGNAPPPVNDQQWRNQVMLYQPAEGWYVAPRAPTDTWNLWHEAHIDGLFDRLIDDFLAVRGVNPDRVYVMGYSAGGDGVWQLAPRMADRWAAAAMMAGHPNDASLLSLRNLPMALFVGGEDRAFDRHKVVAERGEELGRLRKADPGGYEHFVRVYPGLPHWMNRKDAEALPWMAERTRQPWPQRVVWLQDDVTRTRFYWLSVPAAEAKAGRRIDAEVKGRTIALGGDVPRGTTLRLSDALLSLDEPLKVTVNGKEVFSGKAVRTEAAIRQSLEERADPAAAATALVELK